MKKRLIRETQIIPAKACGAITTAVIVATAGSHASRVDRIGAAILAPEMTKMPKEFVPEVTKSNRINNPTVACKLPDDLIVPFYALCNKTGLAPSRLCGQMIRHALESMK